MKIEILSLFLLSPSSRRAWIEISTYIPMRPSVPVALLAEGVDRNKNALTRTKVVTVALLAEGVDRNNRKQIVQYKDLGRPPRGGRG